MRRSARASSIRRRNWNWRSARIRLPHAGREFFLFGSEFSWRRSRLFRPTSKSNTTAAARSARTSSAMGLDITGCWVAGWPNSLALAPAVGAAEFVPGGNPSNPLDYAVSDVFLANGIGFSSEIPAFGQPGGQLGPDNRISFYIGDSWKLRHNLTLTYGVRYVRDTGRTDSDLKPNPCSELGEGIGDFLAANGSAVYWQYP